MDVADLREFYGSRLGGGARRMIAHRIRERFGNLDGMSVLGLGFTPPYLDLPAETGRVLHFMMAQRGVMHWPPGNPNAASLIDECDLPLLESTVDFALVIHGLELSDHPIEMLGEIWRVLSPQGRLLVVAPNRRGMWARSDRTPFGYGQPYSRSQLQQILKDTRFSPTYWSQALFMPPLERSLVLKSAPAWERFGLWTSAPFSGVIIAEAVKQVYAISSGKRARRMLPRLQPAPALARFHRPL
ncbi:methyltransferase domain-containing protein [soil metagenome]